MFEDDDSECRRIYDYVLDYYSKLYDCDDVEIKLITNRLVSYYMDLMFSDLGNGFKELVRSL